MDDAAIAFVVKIADLIHLPAVRIPYIECEGITSNASSQWNLCMPIFSRVIYGQPNTFGNVI